MNDLFIKLIGKLGSMDNTALFAGHELLRVGNVIPIRTWSYKSCLLFSLRKRFLLFNLRRDVVTGRRGVDNLAVIDQVECLTHIAVVRSKCGVKLSVRFFDTDVPRVWDHHQLSRLELAESNRQPFRAFKPDLVTRRAVGDLDVEQGSGDKVE